MDSEILFVTDHDDYPQREYQDETIPPDRKSVFYLPRPATVQGSDKYTDQLTCNIRLYRAGVIPDRAKVQARQNACWNQSPRSYVCSRFTPSRSSCCAGTTPLLAVGGICGETLKSAVRSGCLGGFCPSARHSPNARPAPFAGR